MVTARRLAAAQGMAGARSIRFALQVDDVQAAVERAPEYDAFLVREPALTPWNDLNARTQSPEGQQIALYQVLPDD